MDAIALHQYGFDCAVASLGTSLTEEHADDPVQIYRRGRADLRRRRGRAERHTPRHPDAGEGWACGCKVLRMQGAKDPDEFLNKYGADRFSLLLDKSENQAEYQLEQLEAQV